MPLPIYLDYNATTPIDAETVDAMLPYLRDGFGNPSSSHPYGREAYAAIEKGRAQVAALINALPEDIVFTSGGTEANNMLLKGVAEVHRQQGGHIITTAIEHPAILEPCDWLAERGFEITFLPVDRLGRVNPDDVERAIRANTILISVMLANNEIGTIQPIMAIAEIGHQHGIIVHTDAAQAVGKIPVDVEALDIDFLSVAGHKLYAPKGIGVLYARDWRWVPKFMHGAGHERGRRAGTENTPYIVGLGHASEIAQRTLKAYIAHTRAMRDRLWHGLSTHLTDLRWNGDPENGLPNTLNVSFRGIEANTLLGQIADEVAASAGAACHADSITVSRVIEAIGVPLDYAMGTVRLTVGKYTTPQEIDSAITVIVGAVKQMRVS